MNPFEFFIPQNITVGAGTLAKLPECAKKLGGSHAMLDLRTNSPENGSCG